MSAYRESPPGMPEPPKRGEWREACPHGVFSKWQWSCENCRGNYPGNYPVPTAQISMAYAIAFWAIVAALIYLAAMR